MKGHECCGSDEAVYAGIIVNSCCWESCGCCCSISMDNCDFLAALITAKFIAAVALRAKL